MAAVNSAEAFAAASAHGITGGVPLVAFAYGYEQGLSKYKSKLENCTLTYFGIPGRAETVRMALALSGLKFNDERIQGADFGKRKAAGEFPFGSLPVLTLADGTKICQSRSMLRFVGKLAGLYPHCPVAAAHVDAVVDAIEDFYDIVMSSTRGVDKKSPEFLEKRKEVATTGKLAQAVDKLEAFVQKHGSEGFAVGKQLTLADMHIYSVITFFGAGFWDGIPIDFTNKHARLTSIRKNTASHKAIAAYYDGKKEKSNYDKQYIAARDL